MADVDYIAEARKAVDAARERMSINERKVSVEDFYAFMPMHQYLYVPTRELWPASSVDGRIAEWPKDPATNKPIRPSQYLDAARPVEQMTWCPGLTMIVEGKVVAGGGWSTHSGSRVFNLYRSPPTLIGDPMDVQPWRDHLRLIYPDAWEHIERWLAHRVQRPGEKINHALVLGGKQGIGKDSLLEPVKQAVGHWNWSEVSPAVMLQSFNAWCRAVVVRISEARDLGDVDRFKFYEHSKTYIVAPPDVLTVNEKHVKQYAVFNVCGVVITTNHRTDGIYLPADDRRHFVAWSEASKEDFPEDYWTQLWDWYGRGGIGNVAAYLRTLDLSGFDAKAPPPKTAAFHAIVDAGRAPEDSELADAIEHAGHPDAVTLEAIIANARALHLNELANDLADRKARRSVPHKMERVGYIAVRNPDAQDGHWKVAGRRGVVYARADLSYSRQVRAARELCR